jgi:uncharacterized protein YlbG (UPF0298 family)
MDFLYILLKFFFNHVFYCTIEIYYHSHSETGRYSLLYCMQNLKIVLQTISELLYIRSTVMANGDLKFVPKLQ